MLCVCRQHEQYCTNAVYNTDIDYWKAEWKPLINNMNKRKEYWATVAQQAPKLPDFLKTIHN